MAGIVWVAFTMEGSPWHSVVRCKGCWYSANSGRSHTVKNHTIPCPTWDQPTDFHVSGWPIDNNLNLDPNSVLHENEACRAFKTVWPWDL